MQDSAFRYAEVAEKFRVLQDTLLATMIRIDPNARVVLDRMREIERQITELDAAEESPSTPSWAPGSSPTGSERPEAGEISRDTAR